MIPKRIDRDPKKADSFSDLGTYIAAAKEKGEKLDKFWISNCKAGADLSDLELALMEIDATRSLKPGIDDKTYHLVVSFRPDEEKSLTQDQLQDIERAFANALGYGDHQRVAGTHINTDNFHMHIAINKIHPTTGRCHTPRQDFKILAKVAREMERKYELVVDKGMTDPDHQKSPISPKARDYEARTWEQSFERQVLEQKDLIMTAINQAKSWAEAHAALDPHGVVLKKRGAGLVITKTVGKGHMKASSLDRSISLAKLEKRWGPYTVPVPVMAEKQHSQVKTTKAAHSPKPITRHPGQNRLWRAYLQKQSSVLSKGGIVRPWKNHLLAAAYEDPLAMAIVMTYRDLLRSIDKATSPGHPKSYQPPKRMEPVVKRWLNASSWNASATPWLDRKLDDLGLKADNQGHVLFPLRDDQGHIWALRAMDGQGRTTDIGDSNRLGLNHIIDPDGVLTSPERHTGQVIVTTDSLLAATLHKDTDQPVVLVAQQADLPHQTKALRTKHPDCQITVAATSKTYQTDLAAKVSDSTVLLIDTIQAQSKAVADLAAKGQPVPVDHRLAEKMGAFVETAISLNDISQPASKGNGGMVR